MKHHFICVARTVQSERTGSFVQFSSFTLYGL